MDFFSIDFETANPDQSSICQIGLAKVDAGAVISATSELVDPQTHFDPYNTFIHGIEAHHVEGAPKLGIVLPELLETLSGNHVVSHSPFDRTALTRAAEAHGLTLPPITWIDTMRIARRAWPDQFGISGYGLSNIAKTFGITFDHHDAGEDARVAALIMLRAIEDTGIALADWPARMKRSIRPRFETASGKDHPPNPDGTFFGNLMVFTGALSLPRGDAMEKAAEVGFEIKGSVSKKVGFIVVGNQDAKLMAPGQSKSSKHRKAEELIAAGHDLKILTEADFLQLVSQD
ncbi:exonuclease domain-containing protein [Mangrovicoccus ximenensis]|uniref:exonuclease domain-containing protein n=1 Tax=Mangrovicoccus ximenensis TaxID=1911570 RepID=UPI000D3B446D|nr:exonuclease domain-containing protein [Mangrovicoccus ximenensis]